jgi:DNA-binding NtrC family response regulator
MKNRILFVDDEEAFLFAAKKLLSRNGVEVHTAETKDEALAMIDENEYDAVITDVRLTGVFGEEGLDILKYVKEHKPQTKVILITGYGTSEIKKKAILLGADFYFEKPVSHFILKDALKNLGINYLS